MLFLVYMCGAVCVYRLVKPMLGGSKFGTTGNIICDFITISFILTSIFICFIDDDLMGIIVHLVIIGGLFWYAWVITKMDIKEGSKNGNELAEALLQLGRFLKRHKSIVYSIGVIAFFVGFFTWGSSIASEASTKTNSIPYSSSTHIESGDERKNNDRTPSSSNQTSSNHYNSSSSTNCYDFDDYDGYGYYDDFEDFYNDHYDDFDSYEEAEDYCDTYY